MSEETTAKAEPKPKAAPRKRATAAAKEGEKLPSTTPKKDLGPFEDNATPVGAALEATLEEVDYTIDFESDEAFTVTKGDVFVAVRQINQRNVVEVAPAGWVGPGQIFAPYQIAFLEKALAEVKKKLRKS